MYSLLQNATLPVLYSYSSKTYFGLLTSRTCNTVTLCALRPLNMLQFLNSTDRKLIKLHYLFSMVGQQILMLLLNWIYLCSLCFSFLRQKDDCSLPECPLLVIFSGFCGSKFLQYVKDLKNYL